MSKANRDEQPRLPFPTRMVKVGKGEIEEYVIPKDKKAEVLKELCFLDPVPSLDEERYDLHDGKLFVVREFRVTREHGRNWLVSPFYFKSGGSVIDWMPASWGRKKPRPTASKRARFAT